MSTAPGSMSAIADDGPPQRYARGWHCLGLAESFARHGPRAINIFGQKLVVFQGQSGGFGVLDAYCPHMGASLEEGAVKGDTIACGFHDWRWGFDGACKQIPYAKIIPSRARIGSWPVMVRNSQLFVYHDSEKNPPPPGIDIPDIQTLVPGEYTPWTWDSMIVDTHCRELIDNLADPCHNYYVHNVYPVALKNVFEGHTAGQWATFRSRRDQTWGNSDKVDSDDFELYIESVYYGPATNLNYQRSSGFDGKLVEAYITIAHYPIDLQSFNLQFGVAIKIRPEYSQAQLQDIAQSYAAATRQSFFEDVRIWRSKRRLDRPLLSAEDGPIMQLRRWYDQFYVDASDVTPEMARRFELDIDLSGPAAYWREQQAVK